MKKTFLPILLSMVLLFSFVIPVSAASGKLNATAKVNDDATSFTIDLLIEDNPGFIALTASVSYDDKVLKLKAADNGEIFESIFMPSQHLTVNPYEIIWMEATASEDIKTNGVLAKYTFEVLDSAALGKTEIKFNIDEVVNYAKDNSVSFKGCTFNVDVNGIADTTAKLDEEISISPEDTEDTQTDNTTENAPSQNTDSGDKITASDTIVVQKPLPAESSDAADSNSSSLEGELQENIADTDSNEQTLENEDDLETNASIEDETEISPEDDSDDYYDDSEEPETENKKEDRTIITIVSILAILVAGVCITLIAMYFRKKSQNAGN